VDSDEELIRSIWARWNAGEREVDLEVMDPELEIHSALAEGQVFRGVEGFRAWAAEIDEQFDDWDLGLDGLRPFAPGWYIGHGSVHARARRSGIVLDQPMSWLVEVRDGRLRAFRNFIGPDAEQAVSEVAAEISGRRP
jgi:ketosteroid isomerase-like protein